MNQECLAKKSVAGKKTAAKKARVPDHRLAKSVLNNKELVYRSVESVGNQHYR